MRVICNLDECIHISKKCIKVKDKEGNNHWAFTCGLKEICMIPQRVYGGTEFDECASCAYYDDGLAIINKDDEENNSAEFTLIEGGKESE